MVKLNRIYTKTGDSGETGLATGKRRRKDDLRVTAYGTVDEANAVIGMARLEADAAMGDILERVQNDLFDLGADLSTPEDPKEGEALRIVASQVEALETAIDRINGALSPLTSFILPGGNRAAAALHLARCVVRRAERYAVALQAKETVNPQAIAYLNRLSDLLFVMARAANNGGKDDRLWRPGGSRGASF